MKVIQKIRFALVIENEIFYINGSETLPPPLTREEEQHIMENIAKGDSKAREPLIVHNLRLVVYIAKKFETPNASAEDLISIGTIGLIKAVNTFSPEKNIKLATYASRCIENEILMYYRSSKKYNKDISINESVGFDNDGNEITFLDILKTPKPDFALDIYNNDNINLLKEYFNVLTKREKEIIIKRYGLNGNDEVTQKEIAKELGISRSYVSRIEKRALTKILREFKIKNKMN